MELNEREAHCVARLLQGGLFAEHLIDACQYCKYQCYKENDERDLSMFSKIRNRLTEETGVDLGYTRSEFYGSNFDYLRFLKNTNEETRDYFKNYFAKI